MQILPNNLKNVSLRYFLTKTCEILSNNRYTEKVKKLSKTFHDVHLKDIYYFLSYVWLYMYAFQDIAKKHKKKISPI